MSQFDGVGFTVNQIKQRGQFTLYLALRRETIQMLKGDNIVKLNLDQHIVLNEITGKRWDEKLFSKAFLKFTRRAGLRSEAKEPEKIKDKRTFHDIRRTALSEMGNTGATNAEIVSYSGHNIASGVISDYVKPDKEASRRAFIKRFPEEVKNNENKSS